MPSSPSSEPGRLGDEIHSLIRELFPVCRSITGEGVRETLRRLGRTIPLEIRRVPTGTRVFDWEVPREWNIRDAYVKNPAGDRVVDFRASNLHVVSYSVPVRKRVSREELLGHLHTLPEHPGWIPYRTSYYKETWGFCVPHRLLEELTDDEYEVCIDSTLEDGHLDFGEVLLEGETSEEVLISTHVCHPSLANDNLSGIGVAAALAEHLGELEERRYSYRFLFIPGTIGSITWLALNRDRLKRIRHGLVLSNLGDSGRLVFKRSRRGTAPIDRAVEHVLKKRGDEHEIRGFTPYGYDERQYCSPGIDLPVGRLSRTPHGEFPEYHTSADDLNLVRPEFLADSFETCLSVLQLLEDDGRYLNLNPMCEPQLGRRGLYRSLGGGSDQESQLALLWVLNLSDGDHSLLDVAERAKTEFGKIKAAADTLEAAGLLRRLED